MMLSPLRKTRAIVHLGPALVDFSGVALKLRNRLVSQRRPLQTLAHSDWVECSGLVSRVVEGEGDRGGSVVTSSHPSVLLCNHLFLSRSNLKLVCWSTVAFVTNA